MSRNWRKELLPHMADLLPVLGARQFALLSALVKLADQDTRAVDISTDELARTMGFTGSRAGLHAMRAELAARGMVSHAKAQRRGVMSVVLNTPAMWKAIRNPGPVIGSDEPAASPEVVEVAVAPTPAPRVSRTVDDLHEILSMILDEQRVLSALLRDGLGLK